MKKDSVPASVVSILATASKFLLQSALILVIMYLITDISLFLFGKFILKSEVSRLLTFKLDYLLAFNILIALGLTGNCIKYIVLKGDSIKRGALEYIILLLIVGSINFLVSLGLAKIEQTVGFIFYLVICALQFSYLPMTANLKLNLGEILNRKEEEAKRGAEIKEITTSDEKSRGAKIKEDS